MILRMLSSLYMQQNTTITIIITTAINNNSNNSNNINMPSVMLPQSSLSKLWKNHPSISALLMETEDWNEF